MPTYNTTNRPTQKKDFWAIKNLVTPIGEASFAMLMHWSDKFKKEGEFMITLRFNADDPDFIAWKEYHDWLTDAWFDIEGEDGNDRYDPFRLSDDGASYTVKLKQIRKFEDKKGNVHIRRIKVYDGQRNPITDENFRVGNGSKVRVAYNLNPWKSAGMPNKGVPPEVGISMRMDAAQILEHVPYVDAADAFGEVEGAFTVGEGTPF